MTELSFGWMKGLRNLAQDLLELLPELLLGPLLLTPQTMAKEACAAELQMEL